MVEFEADDALAAAAVKAAADPRVERVMICTPDKDLAQCVRGARVVQLNRRTNVIMDEAGVTAKFGVCPDRFPITSRWSAMRPTATRAWLAGGRSRPLQCSARFGHLESIPGRWRTWGVNAANPSRLSATLARDRDLAFLFRDLATLRTDIPLFESVDQLRWNGPTPAFPPIAARMDRAHTGTPGERRRG